MTRKSVCPIRNSAFYFNAVSRKQILVDVWESDLYDENIVNTYIKRLRLKLGVGEGYIKSIRSVGYMFEAELK